MHSYRPRNALQSISKLGRQACSNTTSASHISPPPYRPAASARSCRTKSPRRGEDPRTSDSKGRPRGEAPLMSDKITGQRHHGQPILSAHRAASAITANQTASRVRAARCPFPCDLRHKHRMGQIRGRSQEGHLSTVDCRLRRGECTAMCNSPPFYLCLEDTFFHAYLSMLGISGVICACTGCTI